MKIRLLGRDGQVAHALAARLGIGGLSRAEVDFERPDAPAKFVTPDIDVLINAVAYTAVDAAEEDKARAYAVNAEALGYIGEAARKNDVLVVHYSTDYVFDGTAAGAYAETAATNPLSVYGASKLEGERLLAASGARYIILRTSWVYAPVGKNFPLTILRLARERDALTVVADQHGAPTPASLIAEVTAQVIANPVPGLYHLAPTGETSWHGFAQLLIDEAGTAGADLKLKPEGIRAIPAADYPTKAVRPANSRLDTAKLQSTFGITLPPWQDGVRQLIATLATEGRL